MRSWSRAKRMISPSLAPLRMPLNALKESARQMARFIPNAAVQMKSASAAPRESSTSLPNYRLRAEALATLPLPSMPESGVVRIRPRDRGGLRSSRADRGAQVLPLGGATVPPWLPAKSARVSNLPACCALGPPASAAPYSCRHEPCIARSAWPPRGMAGPFAWIEPRSEERRSP